MGAGVHLFRHCSSITQDPTYRPVEFVALLYVLRGRKTASCADGGEEKRKRPAAPAAAATHTLGCNEACQQQKHISRCARNIALHGWRGLSTCVVMREAKCRILDATPLLRPGLAGQEKGKGEGGGGCEQNQATKRRQDDRPPPTASSCF